MTCAPSNFIPERHPGGRPRTVSLPPEEMEKLGQEMVDWVRQNNPIHLSQWYSCYKHFTKKQWKTMIHCEEFLPYYEEALFKVGYNYLTKDSIIESSLKHRWLRHYFSDLREQEDEDAKAASNLKKEENKATSEADSAKLDTFINMVSMLQTSSKELKSAATNIISDEKS